MVETIEPQGVEIREQVAETPEEPTSTKPGSFGYQIDDILEAYFTEHGANLFPFLNKDKVKLAKMAKLMPRLITITPTVLKSGNDNYNRLVYDFSSAEDTGKLKYFLDKYLRSNAQDMDFVDSIEDPTVLFPEMNVLTSINTRITDMGFPYMVVMGMKPELRDLPALAISEKDTSNIFAVYLKANKPKDKIIDICTPTLAELLAVADKYDARQHLGEVLKDMKRVSDLYLQTWNNGSA